MNLGTALGELGAREVGTARLGESVAAFREALKEYTRERVPPQWAMIQDNLGSSLWLLGQKESGTKSFEEAVSAYGEALKEYARERAPLQWANTTGNQGVAMMLLAGRLGDAKMATQAARQIETALMSAHDGGNAHSGAFFIQKLAKR